MLSVPSFVQSPGFCGPTALRMVLGSYGIRKSERELAKLAGATPSKGVGVAGILQAATALGLHAYKKDNASFADIRRCLSRNIPPIVDWFSWDDGHYSVVIGLTRTHILLRDPAQRAIRRVRRVDFLRCWFDFPKAYIRDGKEMILRRMIVVEPQT